MAEQPLVPTAACVEAIAESTETGLPADSAADSADADSLTYYQSLVTGGTGQKSHVPDQRITNVSALPAGPFQLTSSTLPYHQLLGQSRAPLLPDVAAAELQLWYMPAGKTPRAATASCSHGLK